jgi:hypothetical protein
MCEHQIQYALVPHTPLQCTTIFKLCKIPTYSGQKYKILEILASLSEMGWNAKTKSSHATVPLMSYFSRQVKCGGPIWFSTKAEILL